MKDRQKIPFLLAVVLLLNPLFSSAQQSGAGVCGEFRTEWKSCQQDGDCVQGRDACGFPAAYNRQYLEDAQKHAACQAPMLECYTPSIKSVALPTCEAGTCSIEVQTDE